jgi:hypothetical protein
MIEIKLSDLKERYFFCDPAGGKQQVKGVRSRSAVVGVAPYDVWLIVLYAKADRCPTDKLIKRILSVCEEWKPRLFGIESNAMQSKFADSVQYAAKLEHKRYPIVGVNQPTKIDKLFRIRSVLQPIIGFGRLIIREDQTELRSELASFPMSATKDVVDCLASACAMVPARTTRAERDGELERRLRYLRESGAPASYISDVASGAVA